MKLFLFFIALLATSLNLQAQYHNSKSKSELGFLIGGSNYFGDLSQFGRLKDTKLSGGIIYRYNVHSRMSLRANLSYGKVTANDADSKIDLIRNRNLNFESDIFELAGGLEFTYLPFFLGSEKYRGTAYILAEIGMFRMNPKTEYNGEMIELHPIGTEGQGSSLNNKKNYSLTQLCVPLGVGVKFALGKKATINLEYGIRKTFTDYLDDVGSNTYVDAATLAAENGPMAAALSNRSLDGSRYGKRGNSATSDWYSFYGAMVTFRLGKPNRCTMP